MIAGSPVDDRVRFVMERCYEFDGVRVEHGHWDEVINTVRPDSIIIEPSGQRVLVQPWGSVFVIKVLNPLKKTRPYVDRIQPLSRYLVGALFFDTFFSLRLAFSGIYHLFRDHLMPLFLPGGHKPRHRRVLDLVQMALEFGPFQSLEGPARRFLMKTPDLHAYIMGHTHFPKVRRFAGDKMYVNTGTWTDLISLEIPNFGIDSRKCYAVVEHGEGRPPYVRLRQWFGYHDLARDIDF
jgi:hypothetical protein